MYYYHLILTLFNPLLDIPTDKTPSPHQIVADATRFLQTLIRVYYLRHGYEAIDLFIVIPLMLSASDCVDALDAADTQTLPEELELLRSTLILIVMGLSTQRKNHYLANTLFHVIRGACDQRMLLCSEVLETLTRMFWTGSRTWPSP